MEDKDREIRTAPEYKMFVGGHWLAGQEWFEVSDKVSSEVIGTVPRCDDELYEMAVMAAHDSGPALLRLRAERRAAGLRRWADSLVRARDTMAATLERESAVPLSWAHAEVDQAAFVLRRLAGECERSEGETVTLAGEAGLALTSVDFSLRQPVGTVAAMLPDRHPLYYAAELAGAAIATGCPVILSAGLLAPLSVKQFVEQGSQLSWPAGSLNLLYGSTREVGLKLAADARVALLAVAGFVADRDALLEARGNRSAVTLGTGFGCALLDRQADVAQVTTRLLGLRFRSPRIGRPAPFFVVVPQAQAIRFGESLAAGLAALKGTRPSDASSEVPWQITDSSAARAVEWLEQIRTAGGIVSHGGQRQGTYIEPTVLTAPAGYRPIAAPPASLPVFIVDSYDKQPERHLHRVPALEEVYIFAGSLQASLELARIPQVNRVEIFQERAGALPAGEKPPDLEEQRLLLGAMARRKWVGVHLSG
jgi:acyl-CoA reductase-like NAD-dependent aldehyde dehydrogenase